MVDRAKISTPELEARANALIATMNLAVLDNKRNGDRGSGQIICPCCGGSTRYWIQGPRGMRSECDTCDLKVIV
jgi:hypothetical protein